MGSRSVIAPALIAVAAIAAACSSGRDNSGYHVPNTPVPQATPTIAPTPFPTLDLPLHDVQGERITTPSGLVYIDTEQGTGATPRNGQQVEVNYTGWLENGTKFDSSLDARRPLKFALGSGQVIPGWDEGLSTMKVGGKRRLIIPPQLGYGDKGNGAIPPNATLIFDVELMSAQG